MQGDVKLTGERALDALRTVQLLEEAFGPKGYRRLAGVISDAEQDIVDELSQLSFRQMRELESITDEWRRLREGMVAPPAVEAAPEAFSRQELIGEFLEMKREEVQVLREAARDAPTRELGERIHRLAAEQSRAADKLADLLD